MAETDPENKRKASLYQKNLSRKKHRAYFKKEPGHEVQNIESIEAQTKEELIAKARNYLETNTQARVQQFVSKKDLGKVEPAVETEMIELEEGNPDRKIKIGYRLDPAFREKLIQLLRNYADVFAWSPEDMPGLKESVAVHSLDVNPNRKPVKQKRKNFAPERQKAIDEEVEKLLKAGIVCEIKYPEWLANVVLVKKPNGKWRMCVDYTNLNAVCPKDPYPLPSIDHLIDATAGHVMFSFMDAFSGYNQIKMNPADIAKTAFITHRAVYAYKYMPYGLMNAGSTYQSYNRNEATPDSERNPETGRISCRTKKIHS